MVRKPKKFSPTDDDIVYDYDMDDFSSGVFYRQPTVAEQRKRAEKEAKRLKKEGEDLEPIKITSKKMAHSFWGKAWCANLERHHDYENRLPRGRSYAKNGCIIDLKIEKGKILSRVMGSELYDVEIKLETLSKDRWLQIVDLCSGQVTSVLDLLSGKLSDETMAILTDEAMGLFPEPSEINMSCNCPDYADMCKHIAATLYGVGSRLDDNPELFFTLRSVAHEDLLKHASDAYVDQAALLAEELSGDEIEDLFGIELHTK